MSVDTHVRSRFNSVSLTNMRFQHIDSIGKVWSTHCKMGNVPIIRASGCSINIVPMQLWTPVSALKYEVDIPWVSHEFSIWTPLYWLLL